MKRLWLIIFLLYTGCDSIKKDQIGPYYGGISEREAAGTIFTNELWVCLEESNGNYFLDSSCGEGKNTYLLTKERKKGLERKEKKAKGLPRKQRRVRTAKSLRIKSGLSSKMCTTPKSRSTSSILA